MKINIPRIFLSGLSGGSGKTFISLALSRAWSRKNINVLPFKKGPDYIDPAWLSLACKRNCYCLDSFFLKDVALKNHFLKCIQENTHCMDNNSITKSIALIEGNRGLFDGRDVHGTCSSAHLAKLLDCPVIVSINCTKMTRTVAALVMGLQHFDKELNIAGVILNNTGSERHAKLVQECVETYTDIQVLGVLPRMRHNPIPERHMGLHLHKEGSQNSLLNNLADFFEEHVDSQKIMNIACQHSNFEYNDTEFLKHTENIKLAQVQKNELNTKVSNPSYANLHTQNKSQSLNIAYIYDDALWFYYQENLDALKKQEANLIPLSILDETPFYLQIQNYLNSNKISRVDALYIGGGFPELYAQDIAYSPHLATLRNWIEEDMPVYAECGGFMLLSKALHIPSQSLISRSKNNSIQEKSRSTGEHSSKSGFQKCNTLEKSNNLDDNDNTKATNQNLHPKEIFSMAHIFEAETEFFLRPQGLGYIIAKTLQANPFHPLETIWHGHEFHFSKSIQTPEIAFNHYMLGLEIGHGMEKVNTNKIDKNKIDKRNETVTQDLKHKNEKNSRDTFKGLDGLLYKQCFACYAHLFAPAVPHWAYHFIQAAKAHKNGKKYIAK